jgi:hypothetical protein
MKRMFTALFPVIICVTATAAEWAPVKDHIMTPFAEVVTPETVHQEYPRPQMVRDRWENLNGLWDYAMEALPEGAFAPVQGLHEAATMTDGKAPASWDGKILVPFAVDAPLSGVMKILRPDQRLWYRRPFTVPITWRAGRVLLHFEAVDWETSVYINGDRLGQHRGGYDPFTFDITDALRYGENELVVAVWDATEQQAQAIGKQIMPENRKGFRYQPTGGIWRTVWLEPVAETSIERLKIVPDVDSGQVRVAAELRGDPAECRLEVDVIADERKVAMGIYPADAEVGVVVPDAKLWSPDSPFLYDLNVRLVRQGKVLDTVDSYFGMRKISVGKDDSGFTRILLNNEFVFQYGPLDQGYWPDGILTPPTDEAARFDIEFLKAIGCNMVRVHIKTHPDRWYYWCDRLGLIVWQDMICMPKYGQTVDPKAAQQWELEFARMIDWLYNHPSIVMWVPFNEGWSQYDTERITQWVKDTDPSRLVNNASGWTDHGVGDLFDVHDYTFYPSIPLPESAGGRALVLGEAGGHNITIPDHTWYTDVEPSEKMDFVNDINRVTYPTPEKMIDGYGFWLRSLPMLKDYHGLNAAVYTQITDVEHELNGFMTYDRIVPKFDIDKMRAMHMKLYEPAPTIAAVLPLSKDEPQTWKMRTDKPAGEWTEPDYDDGGWKTAVGPFGKTDGPLKVGTTIEAKTIYLRKTFTLDEVPDAAAIRVAMCQSAEVYLNGTMVRTLQSRGREGQIKAGDVPLRTDEMKLLRQGKNVIAVAHQTGAGAPQYFDIGVIAVQEK